MNTKLLQRIFLATILFLFLIHLAFSQEIGQALLKETDTDGNTILKTASGEIYGNIPKWFEVESGSLESKSFVLKNVNPTDEKVLEINGNKIIVSPSSHISFSDEGAGVKIVLNGTGSFGIGNIQMSNIKDAKINIGKSNQIEYADFTSVNGGLYAFKYQNNNFIFTAKQEGHITFDPLKRLVSGENTTFEYNGKLIDASKFYSELNEAGDFKQVFFSEGGSYKDYKSKQEYSSKEAFSVFLDGRDIKDSYGNAISVLEYEWGKLINSKGLVKISGSITYEGLSEDAYSEYHVAERFFDVKKGDFSIDNGNHKVIVKGGDPLFFLSKSGFGSGDSFKFRCSTEQAQDYLNFILDESAGQVFAFKDGSSNVFVVNNLAKSEEALKDRTILSKQKMIENIDNAIAEQSALIEGNPLAKLGLADLYRQKASISDSILKEYKVGQMVFDTSTKFGLESVESTSWTIEKINIDGTYTLQDIIGNEKILTKQELDNLLVSKLTIGQKVNDAPIKSMFYDNSEKKLFYLLEGNDKRQSETDILNSYFREDYKTAIAYYEEIQNDPALSNDAKFGLAKIYGNMGNLQEAESQYKGLLGQKDLTASMKYEAYAELTSTYLKEGNPRAALGLIYDATKDLPNNKQFIEVKRDLIKSYLDVISSAISTDGNDILSKYAAKIGADMSYEGKKEWYTAGMDAWLLSFAKGNLGTVVQGELGKISEQQKGIWIIKELLDKGETLESIRGISGSRLQRIFETSDERAAEFRLSIGEAFQNPDVENLLNGGQLAFEFETGTGYVDKSFLDKTWREKIASDINLKTNIEFAALGLVGGEVFSAYRASELYGAQVLAGGELSLTGGKYAAYMAAKDFLNMPVSKLFSKLFTDNLAAEKAIEDSYYIQLKLAEFGKVANAEGKFIKSLNFKNLNDLESFITSSPVTSGKTPIKYNLGSSRQYVIDVGGEPVLVKLEGTKAAEEILSKIGTEFSGVSRLKNPALFNEEYLSYNALIPNTDPSKSFFQRVYPQIIADPGRFEANPSKLASYYEALTTSGGATGETLATNIKKFQDMGFKVFFYEGSIKEASYGGVISIENKMIVLDPTRGPYETINALAHEFTHFDNYFAWAKYHNHEITQETYMHFANINKAIRPMPEIKFFNPDTGMFVYPNEVPKGSNWDGFFSNYGAFDEFNAEQIPRIMRGDPRLTPEDIPKVAQFYSRANWAQDGVFVYKELGTMSSIDKAVTERCSKIGFRIYEKLKACGW